MADILSSIGNAITLAKRLKEISDNIKDAELKNVLADLSLELADTKLKLADIITENADLKTKLLDLENIRENNKLVFKHGLYYLEGDDHPFCPSCYDSDKSSIRLKKSPAGFDDFGKVQCPKCNNFFC